MKMAKHVVPIVATTPFERYYEPFCGGAAIFFESKTSRPSFLNDKNPQIIKIYSAIKADPRALFEELKELSMRLYEEGGDVYYEVRERAETAAEWLFLFTSSFNGLIRFSTKDPNKFNASWGKRYSAKGDALSMKYPLHELVTLEKLEAMSAALANATITNGDYWESCIKDCGEGDFIYLDPPYSFNGKDEASDVYNMTWSPGDDVVLAGRLTLLKHRGVKFVLSNVSESRGKRNFLYDRLYAGYETKEFEYKHTIAKYSSSSVKELLVIGN